MLLTWLQKNEILVTIDVVDDNIVTDCIIPVRSGGDAEFRKF